MRILNLEKKINKNYRNYIYICYFYEIIENNNKKIK